LTDLYIYQDIIRQGAYDGLGSWKLIDRDLSELKDVSTY